MKGQSRIKTYNVNKDKILHYIRAVLVIRCTARRVHWSSWLTVNRPTLRFLLFREKQTVSRPALHSICQTLYQLSSARRELSGSLGVRHRDSRVPVLGSGTIRGLNQEAAPASPLALARTDTQHLPARFSSTRPPAARPPRGPAASPGETRARR